MGKTTTLIHSVRNLINMEEYRDVGVIIFLSRLEEIQKLVKEMGLETNDFSVITSDERYNLLGRQGDRNRARILFTTQQMLESKCKKYDQFCEMRDFLYNDKPRSVRVWDEAIVPSMTITLERTLILQLIHNISKKNKSLADELETFASELKEVEDGSLVQIPDIERHGVDLSDAYEIFEIEEHRTTISALWMLSGRTVRVRRDHAGNTALDYKDILPDDLAPLLILDASGQLRQTGGKGQTT